MWERLESTDLSRVFGSGILLMIVCSANLALLQLIDSFLEVTRNRGMERKFRVGMWKPANVIEETDGPTDLLQAPDPQPAMSALSEPAVHLPSKGHLESVPAAPLLGTEFVFVMIQIYQRCKTMVARTRQFTSLTYDSYHRSNPECL